MQLTTYTITPIIENIVEVCQGICQEIGHVNDIRLVQLANRTDISFNVTLSDIDPTSPIVWSL